VLLEFGESRLISLSLINSIKSICNK